MTIVKIPLEYSFYKQLDYMAIPIISPFETPILSLPSSRAKSEF
jgi:hypothetical protein